MKKILLILIFLFSFSGNVFASGCPCGVIGGMIGAATAEINAHTLAEETLTRTEILLAAQSIIGTMKVNTATIVKAIQALQESNADQIKSAQIAREAMETYDTYSSPAAQPKTLCGSSNLGASIQVSGQVSREIIKDMRDKQLEHNDKADKPLKFLNRILADDHPDIEKMTESIIPNNHTLTNDQVAQAQETIKSLANPLPAPVLTDEIKQSIGGQGYAAARQIHETRLSIAMAALTEHVAYHAPTLPSEVTAWAQEQWTAAGASGPIPGVVNGKMSEAALHNLLSQLRIGNPNWASQVATSNNTGLLRELLQIQAVQLELTRKNNQLLDRLTVLSAVDFLSRMEGMTGEKLKKLYSNAIGTQQ